MAPVAEQSSTAKQHLAPLKIFIDLCLKKRTLDNFLTYLLRWVEQRKASVHLCCKKLKISAMPMDNVVKVLSMVHLDCIQEVQTAGARFTKHGPELLEHVVWSQQLWVLRLTDGSSG